MRGMLLSYSKWGLSIFPPLNIDEGVADEIVKIMDGAQHTSRAHDLGLAARLARAYLRSKL